MDCISLIEKLKVEHSLLRSEWSFLWRNHSAEVRAFAGQMAREIAQSIFQRNIKFHLFILLFFKSRLITVLFYHLDFQMSSGGVWIL